MNNPGIFETDPIESGTIKVTVQDAMIPDSPIDGASVVANPVNPSVGSTANGNTDGDGVASFAAKEGTYDVFVTATGYIPSLGQQTTVKAGKTISPELTFNLVPIT